MAKGAGGLNSYSDAPTCGDLLRTACRVCVFVGGKWQVLVGMDDGEKRGRLWPFVGPRSARSPVLFCPGCGAELGADGRRGHWKPWARGGRLYAPPP